jgi:transglutaminase-like putative cysteine protease
MKEDLNVYLTPTDIIDSQHPTVRQFAEKTIEKSTDPIELVIKLYQAVRDGIRYNPYSPFSRPEHYRASMVLQRRQTFCIPKASLLCALGRACGIPSRVGFATVRNHLATRQLLEFLGSNLFVYHGFVEFHLEGKWVKATPAFNRELCWRHGVEPLDFNGREDSLFQPYDANHHKFMEYLEYHGTHADIPVALIVEAFEKAYGKDRVRRWIQMYEERGSLSPGEFEKEEIVKE